MLKVRLLLLAVLLVVTAPVTVFALGTPIIDSDAQTLALGAFTTGTWTNSGSLGQNWVKGPTTGTLTVVDITDGSGLMLRGVTFAGTNPHMKLVDSGSANIPAPAGVTGSHHWSVTMWVYDPGINKDCSLLAWAPTGGGAGTSVYVANSYDTHYGAIHHGNVDGHWDMPFAQGFPVASKWHHLAFVYDGSVEKVYVNGVLNNVDTKTLKLAAGFPFFLGIKYNTTLGLGYPLTGTIGTVKMYDDAMTDADVEADMALKTGVPSTNGTISGDVTNALGDGVAEAYVGFKLSPQASASPKYFALTDSNGHYSLRVPAGTYYIAAWKQDWMPTSDSAATQLLAGGTATVDLQFQQLLGTNVAQGLTIDKIVITNFSATADPLVLVDGNTSNGMDTVSGSPLPTKPVEIYLDITGGGGAAREISAAQLWSNKNLVWEWEVYTTPDLPISGGAPNPAAVWTAVYQSGAGTKGGWYRSYDLNRNVDTVRFAPVTAKGVKVVALRANNSGVWTAREVMVFGTDYKPILAGTVRDTANNPIYNAAVQVAGYGGKGAVTDAQGEYYILAPERTTQELYTDAYGYEANVQSITIPPGVGIFTQDVTLNAKSENYLVNGDFETAGGGGGSTAAGWDTMIFTPAGNDAAGVPWPAPNADMYSGVRDTAQNTTPGGGAAGYVATGNKIPNPGITAITVTYPGVGQFALISALTSTTVSEASVNWTVDQWIGKTLHVVAVWTGKEKRYRIAGNTSDTITITSGDLVADGFEAGQDTFQVETNTFRNWYYGALYQRIPIDADGKYNFYFKSSGTGGTSRYWELAWLDAGGNEIHHWYEPVGFTWTMSQVGGPTWRQVLSGRNNVGQGTGIPMLRISPPVNAKYADVLVGFSDGTDGDRPGYRQWADDVVVDKISDTTGSIAHIKTLPDETPVNLAARVVSLAPWDAIPARTTSYFYIEEFDRFAGIRVENRVGGSDTLSVNDAVVVSGTMATIPETGERYIQLSADVTAVTGATLGPVGANTRAVWEDEKVMAELVTIAGRLKEMALDKSWFTIADGYSKDGSEVVTKVIVVGLPLPDPFANPEDPVQVTGVVSKEGSSPSTATPVILLREAVKLVILP